MKSNFRNLLMPLLVGAIAVSCEKKELEEVTPNQSLTSEVSSLATSSNILFEETFEGSDIFSGIREQFGTSYAFGVASKPTYGGSKSGRFELRDTDPITSGGTRSEVLFPAQDNSDRWYAFSLYLPSSEWQSDRKQDMICQWHQGGGKNPSSSIRIINDKLLYDVRTEPSSPKRFDLGSVLKDQWQTFVVHVKHSHNSDGLVEIWHNGKKVVNYAGGNGYDSSFESPRWKLGIYKSDWNYEETTDTKKRVLYYDEIRMGNERASLAEMTPRTSTTSSTTSSTTTPTTSTATTNTQDVTLTLVNADTDQDIQVLGNGATINLATLPTKNLNIRATSGSSDVNSVVFNLSGAQSKSVTENRQPFALAGDNMKGDYYAWTPVVGSYSIKASAFSSSNGGGTSLGSSTVSFTVTNQTATSASYSILTNAGGAKLVDSKSRTWSADANFSGGVTSSKSISVSNTSDDALYANYRYASNGNTFSYDVPVSQSGNYTVKLHFVEPYFKSSQSRVFNVSLEGQQKISNYDIYAAVGFGTSVVKTITDVAVTDGKLNIDFTSVKNNAIISGIEIIKQ
ncbi:heparin lyase I family protein [Pontibacter sp. MBLB2868]|uniref:heparin lyase I family protein n=1 Tax=Pontibacter sp. MBLB2868 TaxID=3451555 RepID=UPI003F74E7B4